VPIYPYVCMCGWDGELYAPIFSRDGQVCPRCQQPLMRQLSVPAPHQVRGRVVQGGGPDRFTADMLGVPLKELPAGLKSHEPQG